MRLTIFVLLLLLTYNACIDEISLQTEQEDPIFVIDGVFTNQLEKQKVKVATSIDLNSQIENPVSGATIMIEDNNGNTLSLLEESEGVYTVEAQAIPGRQYRLSGILPDGTAFSSNFQEVPPSFPIDTVHVVDTLVQFVDDSGKTRRLRALDFYAAGMENGLDQDMYLRLSSTTVYQVMEIVCSPFGSPKTCYFYNDQRPLDVNIFQVNATTGPVQYHSLVYRRQINYHFGEVFALDLSLYAYNKAEYTYWEQLQSLFDQEGNITDVIPARITGNLTGSDGTEIQGQWAVVGATNRIRFVRNSDFATQQYPLCGLPGLRPYPLPGACCNCLSLAGAVLEKPDYWP